MAACVPVIDDAPEMQQDVDNGNAAFSESSANEEYFMKAPATVLYSQQVLSFGTKLVD